MDSLRQLLQPITHNLPAPINDAGRNLLGPFCYKTLVHDINLLDHPECVKLAISKGLGIGIIGASAVVKIPQLIKLLNSRSADGVSFLSYLLETSAYLISLTYNIRHGFPFSTFGETALIMVQNVAIAALVLKFGGKGWAVPVWVVGLASALYALFNEQLVDFKTLAYLQAAAGVLGVASKAPQIFTVWQEGGTGQLSAFAVFNYLAGSLSRIFTTLQEVPDPLILWGFVAGFALNAVLAAQMIYYWNSPASNKSKKASKKKSANKQKSLAAAASPAVEHKQKKEPVAFASGASPAAGQGKAKSPSTRRRG